MSAAVRPRRFARALIYAGHAENVGDLAIIIAVSELLRAAGIEEIAISQWAPETPQAAAVFAARGLRSVSSKRVAASLAASRGALHVIGGGQLVRANQLPVALALLLLRVGVGRLTGGRAIAVGLGVSDPGSGLKGALWSRILKSCAAVCVRDTTSAAIARRLGVEPVLTGDVVFLLDALFAAAAAGPRDSIVIAPCIDPGEQRSVNGAHVALLVAEARRRWPAARVVFALHDAREEVDREAMRIVCRDAGLTPDAVVGSGDPAEFAALYGRALLTITNRLHAVIFSLKAQTPFICLNDGGKIGANVADMGLTALPLAATPDAAEVAALVDEAIASASRSLARLRERSEGNRAALMRLVGR